MSAGAGRRRARTRAHQRGEGAGLALERGEGGLHRGELRGQRRPVVGEPPVPFVDLVLHVLDLALPALLRRGQRPGAGGGLVGEGGELAGETGGVGDAADRAAGDPDVAVGHRRGVQGQADRSARTCAQGQHIADAGGRLPVDGALGVRAGHVLAADPAVVDVDAERAPGAGGRRGEKDSSLAVRGRCRRRRAPRRRRG